MFFFQRGLFALALHARLFSAKRHDDAPRRAVVEIAPVRCLLLRKVVGRKRVVGIPRESVRSSSAPVVGSGRGLAGTVGEGDRVWDTRKRTARDGGRAISLGGGEGRQLRSAGWTIGWDGQAGQGEAVGTT